jgi:hypothetical protein
VRRSNHPANLLWDIVDFTSDVQRAMLDPLMSPQSREWSYVNNPPFVLRDKLVNGSPELVEEIHTSQWQEHGV